MSTDNQSGDAQPYLLAASGIARWARLKCNKLSLGCFERADSAGRISSQPIIAALNPGNIATWGGGGRPRETIDSMQNKSRMHGCFTL